ncbi:MAG TPA: polynucleotide adenylyltransferase PcnB [Treponema sp.]|nr:polynucleotide adenylyltransferase PcnB [Treponema sp.]
MLIRYSPDAKGRAVRKALIYTKKEHGIKLEDIDADAIRIITHLRNRGFEGYIVGGAVRDLLIGKKPKDFDIVTNAEPARIKRLFRNSRIIGKRFRLVHIFFGKRIFEVSTFRSVVNGTTGNVFGTMDEDVRRRDFTINALFYDPIKEQVVDYVGGVRDIRNQKLVPVIPLSNIFIEDPVRMLRAVKYAVSTCCTIPRKLSRTIRKSAPLLQPVSPSRLTEEIIKIVTSGNAHDTVAMLLKHDLFMYLQPAANALMDGSKQYALGYRNSLKNLDELINLGEPTRLGRKLVYLVTDLLQCITDWNGQPMEVYAHVYHECRRFVMPMNPPRVELEFAVRYCLKEGGLAIRSPRSRDNRERSVEPGLVKNRNRRKKPRTKAPISSSN